MLPTTPIVFDQLAAVEQSIVGDITVNFVFVRGQGVRVAERVSENQLEAKIGEVAAETLISEGNVGIVDVGVVGEALEKVGAFVALAKWILFVVVNSSFKCEGDQAMGTVNEGG